MKRILALCTLGFILTMACGPKDVPVGEDPDAGSGTVYTVADAHVVYYVSLDGGASD